MHPLGAIGRATRFAHDDGGELWRFASSDAGQARKLVELGRRGIGGFDSWGEDADGAWARRRETRATAESRGPLPWRDALAIGHGAARAFAACERGSLSPGRIHPAAIVLEPDVWSRADECMSCGLESAMAELDGARVSADEVDRAILLSDGAANRGVKDVSGLRRIAGRMRDRGCAVTTIGLDEDFVEKVMAAIATESNGHHYFVADAADLTRVFDRELDALLATVARDAELVIEPARGVEVAEGFDRAFRREGKLVVVPLGAFGTKQEKTALLRLHVPADNAGVPRGGAGLRLARLDLVRGLLERPPRFVALSQAPAGQSHPPRARRRRRQATFERRRRP